jgi:NAD(P)-dependent dehydrogenase (short-subunit alcohol dehydrogenase family)
MGLLEGRFVIVTGAASPRGLGKATAQLFAEHGATVAILDLDAGQAAAAADDLGAAHVGLACNVTDRAACRAAADELVRRWGRIDVLVNNAGITQPLKVMQIEPENYDAVLDVSQAVIPAMREKRSGSIVNLSSVSAQRGGGIFGGPHYSAAKAGVLGLTKAMARELAPDNVRVNAICPGFIATDITAGKLTPQMMKTILDGIPMGRAGDARDVAGCALFLASDLSAYCTGTEVDVNGGALIH